MSLCIRKVNKSDWEQVKQIYEAGIATGIATFETAAPDTYEKWFGESNSECLLVAEEGSTVLGWCKLTPVSHRPVYSGVGEVSIYVHPSTAGKGIGNLLLQALIRTSEHQGFWTLEAKIFIDNKASIQLHKKNGFTVVGVRKMIGKRNGTWFDNLLLERRSSIID